MRKFLGIDLGGTFFKYGVYSESGEDLRQAGVINAVRDEKQKTLDTITGIISQFPDVDGVGLSLPGRIDNETGTILGSGALTPLWGVALKPIFEERFKKPFAFENDANSAALAELWLGGGVGCENFVCITIGTGIGGGIVINNQLYRGSHFFGGEFCYMKTSHDPLEMYNDTSARWLLHSVGTRARIKFDDCQEIFNNLDNPKVLFIYNSWIKTLSLGIYNIGAALDPKKILIGGGLSVQKRIYQDIEAALLTIIHPLYPRFWTVEPCHFGNDAGKIGAIYNLIRRES